MRILSKGQIVLWAAVLTVLFEGITVFNRFGLGLEAARETASTIGRLTGGIRIHHGYIGLALIALAVAVWRKRPALSGWTLAVGIALVGSDLIHHFVVLRLVVGSSEFDLLYPGR